MYFEMVITFKEGNLWVEGNFYIACKLIILKCYLNRSAITQGKKSF